MTRPIQLIAAAAALSVTAVGEDRRIHLSVVLDKAVIAPGDGVKVSVFAEMSEQPGTKLPVIYKEKTYEGTLLAYGSSAFHLHAITDLIQGEYSDLQLHPGFNINGYAFGDPIGNSVFGIHPSQAYPGSPMIPENPIFLWSAVWTPKEYAAETVSFELDPWLATALFAIPELAPYPPTFGAEKWLVTFGSAALTVQASCVPDCDGNNSLDIDDFICFQTFFAIADPKADCDADGQLLIDDFICFQTLYAIGC